MLVLSRRWNQRIIIGDDPDMGKNIIITVVKVRDDKVRLGIEAPLEVPVNREEIWLDKARDGQGGER